MSFQVSDSQHDVLRMAAWQKVLQLNLQGKSWASDQDLLSNGRLAWTDDVVLGLLYLDLRAVRSRVLRANLYVCFADACKHEAARSLVVRALRIQHKRQILVHEQLLCSMQHASRRRLLGLLCRCYLSRRITEQIVHRIRCLRLWLLSLLHRLNLWLRRCTTHVQQVCHWVNWLLWG